MEDIILTFISAATRSLQKDADLVDGGWKAELNSQILVFLDLLSDNLSPVGSGAVELRNRLTSYRTRLQADNRSGPLLQTQATPRNDDKVALPESNSMLSMAVAAALFQLDSITLTAHLQTIRHICTVEAALDDLKVCTVACSNC